MDNYNDKSIELERKCTKDWIDLSYALSDKCDLYNIQEVFCYVDDYQQILTATMKLSNKQSPSCSYDENGKIKYEGKLKELLAELMTKWNKYPEIKDVQLCKIGDENTLSIICDYDVSNLEEDLEYEPLTDDEIPKIIPVPKDVDLSNCSKTYVVNYTYSQFNESLGGYYGSEFFNTYKDAYRYFDKKRKEKGVCECYLRLNAHDDFYESDYAYTLYEVIKESATTTSIEESEEDNVEYQVYYTNTSPKEAGPRGEYEYDQELFDNEEDAKKFAYDLKNNFACYALEINKLVNGEISEQLKAWSLGKDGRWIEFDCASGKPLKELVDSDERIRLMNNDDEIESIFTQEAISAIEEAEWLIEDESDDFIELEYDGGVSCDYICLDKNELKTNTEQCLRQVLDKFDKDDLFEVSYRYGMSFTAAHEAAKQVISSVEELIDNLIELSKKGKLLRNKTEGLTLHQRTRNNRVKSLKEMNDTELSQERRTTKYGTPRYKEIECIDMINSILAYDYVKELNGGDRSTIVSDLMIPGNHKAKYLKQYIDELGEEKVKELIQGQIDDIDKVIVGTDYEVSGGPYNSIKWVTSRSKHNASFKQLTFPKDKDKGVREWYMKEYPTDDFGEEIPETTTFETVFNALKNGEDVYDCLVGDSVVRERVFDELSNILGCDYDDLYYAWLGESLTIKNPHTKEREIREALWYNGKYEYTEEEDKAKKEALANYLKCSVDDLERNAVTDDDMYLFGINLYDVKNGEHSGEEYLVLKGDKEREQAVYDDIENTIESCGGIKETFTPSFVKLILDDRRDFINWESFHQLGYESSDDFGSDKEFLDYCYKNDLVNLWGVTKEAIETDGYGNFLSSWNGEEIELGNDFYAYRTN